MLKSLRIDLPRTGISPLKRVTAWVKRLDNEHRQAVALRNLSDAALRDIGLTRHQALSEADRLSWNPPPVMKG